MLLRFTKMHGLGNDFMVLDLISQHAHIQPKHAKAWGDRHTGVGFDQLLLVEAPTNPDVDFRYRIFNSDGSEVEQCGNGARCFARFVVDKRLTVKKQIRVETKGGVIELNLRPDGQVTVDMGAPRLVPEQIPFQADAEALSYAVEVDGQSVQLAAVSMGNPHAVIEVDDVEAAAVALLGPALQSSAAFPQSANIGFAQVVARDHIRLRVYERGVGETLACGSGACAAAAVLMRRGCVDRNVTVSLPGGDLQLQWPDDASEVIMSGPAAFVFEGEWKQ